ncbi:WecB/TagA/CpsF family glycosyltransferase [Methylobacterium nodulans]|uniref:Glycosyl transferase, WecB/TagA/CpsF family n=1 Tax=Methylobacterium nodulans (strain LMG 21967 / CNCM I-2342 / ORS 2060) TaxID=460265 RepID=B8IQE1_METNO|nr:WecB/TagA/CpsF family glycosyltransferase [Methylobacterium nodulans]ACL60453.1 glycosyl transferase, WecB/TagA/CpsF family [Methylobacterium nodulans ORS 2060]
MRAAANESARPWEQERAPVLGVGVSVITLPDAVLALDAFVRAKRPHYVCITGVHGVIECRKDPRLRAIHAEADLVTPDGVPLVWMSRLLGYGPIGRVYGPDLMREVIRLSPALGYRHFFYGGAPGVAEQLRARLCTAVPGLSVVGIHCPPFRALTPEEDEAIVSEINAAQPDIVWVGLSTPKQEAWMAAHRGRITAPVMVGVGAAFDFLAGTKRQAPRWMQRSGLEWLYRLATEPRRLAGRYGKIVPLFLVLAAGQLLARLFAPGRGGPANPPRRLANGS